MAEGKVVLSAEDWGRIEVALSAVPKMEERLGRIESRLEKPVHEACSEHAACSKAAFGARKFQYVLLGGLIVLNAVAIPTAIALWTK